MISRIVAAALCLWPSFAMAGSVVLQAQYGAPKGFSQSPAGCIPDNYNGEAPCGQISPGARILGWSGTQTVKAPNVEVLGQIQCGSRGLPATTIIWVGEQFQGTIAIVSPALVPVDLQGPCWYSYQISNNTGADLPFGAALEIQLTILYQSVRQ